MSRPIQKSQGWRGLRLCPVAWRCFTIGGLLLLLVGCVQTPEPGAMWVEQYRGLRNIPDATMARKMLANLCESAAYAGDAGAVLMMLRDLEDEPQRHDELAARCVGHLARQDLSGAEFVLDRIEDDGLRAGAAAKLKPTAASPAPADGAAATSGATSPPPAGSPGGSHLPPHAPPVR